MPTDDLEDFVADFVTETGLAWCVRAVPMGKQEPIDIWLPKSQCERESDRLWRVPVWLLRKHDLI